MKVNLPQQINKKQWLDRLGVKGDADMQLLQQMEAAERKLLGAARPQGVYRVLRLKGGADPESKSSIIELPGSAIKKHLEECNGMIVMAVTLGAGIDRLIRTAQIRDMAEAVLMDSGASVLAEQCAGILEEMIRTENGANAQERSGPAAACEAALVQGKRQQVYFTGRYSPGYGDFPIEMQKTLLQTVDGPKNIGLTANESSILIPRKSITAIIGTADYPVTGYLATCDECTIKENCRLRAKGTPCYK